MTLVDILIARWVVVAYNSLEKCSSQREDLKQLPVSSNGLAFILCRAGNIATPLEKLVLQVSREILALSCPVSAEVTSSDSVTVTSNFEPGCFFHPFKK